MFSIVVYYLSVLDYERKRYFAITVNYCSLKDSLNFALGETYYIYLLLKIISF